MMSSQEFESVRLFGADVAVVDTSRAAALLLDWARDDSIEACRYVVTPNVNHVVLLTRQPDFAAAYEDASLILADGMPLVWAGRLLGRRLPGRVAGSDLAPALFRAASEGPPLTVFFLGALPGVAERAAVKVEQVYPGVRVVGTYSPPIGFETDPVESANILERVASAQPQVLVVGLGAPKQELWVHQNRAKLSARVALCIGATIDFLAEEATRAPVWVRKIGLEWAFRVMQEPRRLAGRYWHDGWAFLPLLWKEWRQVRQQTCA